MRQRRIFNRAPCPCGGPSLGCGFDWNGAKLQTAIKRRGYAANHGNRVTLVVGGFEPVDGGWRGPDLPRKPFPKQVGTGTPKFVALFLQMCDVGKALDLDFPQLFLRPVSNRYGVTFPVEDNLRLGLERLFSYMRTDRQADCVELEEGGEFFEAANREVGQDAQFLRSRAGAVAPADGIPECLRSGRVPSVG